MRDYSVDNNFNSGDSIQIVGSESNDVLTIIKNIRQGALGTTFFEYGLSRRECRNNKFKRRNAFHKRCAKWGMA